MRRTALLIIALAIALLLLWLFAPRPEEEAGRRIEGRAKIELIEACNQAAADTGRAIRFTTADVVAPAKEAVETASGVALLASILQARRAGQLCAWNGIDPATITAEGSR
ncbi:hypothetical protein [Methylocystis iwaonis]|uniref:Uncharacterized protein n=1 Tax=Methylocystis iwaonis TaxID=2885079 RepID=A0ABM8EBQ5_9HYPH|nr:hypothetical protein [Methylocystis iwaonis]BDV35438.1 hypothetical protein SS37A_29670 [Methylocystis iwaonis]